MLISGTDMKLNESSKAASLISLLGMIPFPLIKVQYGSSVELLHPQGSGAVLYWRCCYIYNGLSCFYFLMTTA